MKLLRPLKAIRVKCLDCCCGQIVEVRLCNAKDCTLWPYRMGKRQEAGEDTESAGYVEKPNG